MKFIKNFPGLIYKAYQEFQASNPLVLSSSVAFFATFALPPVLIVISTLLGFYFKREELSDELFRKLSNVFGQENMDQFEKVFQNFIQMADKWYIAVFGFVFLIFIVTTFLNIIKTGLNTIWNLQPDSTVKLKKVLVDRSLAFVYIVGTGILFLVLLAVDSSVAFLGDYLTDIFPDTKGHVVVIINKPLSLLMYSIGFSLLFRFLPDAKIGWRPILVGALVTGFLFSIGKFIMEATLVGGTVGTLFGSLAAVMVVLLFIFYSAMIMFFGMSFTKVYSEYLGEKVTPKKYAVQYKTVTLEKGG